MSSEYESHFRNPTYQNIPLFDAQVHSISDDILLDIGKILVKHHMQDKYRAFLLHLHEEPLPNTALVRSYLDSQTEVSQMKSFSECYGKMSPVSFHLNNLNEFEPFEHQQGNYAIPMNKGFYTEVGNFISDRGLRDVIGISRNLSEACLLWEEYCHPSGYGTIAYASPSQEAAKWDGRGVQTEWAFFDDGGIVKYKPTKECKPPKEGGGHVRK